MTQATDQVELVLNFNNTGIGFATLQADGTFSTTVTMPANAPPGTYMLSAILSGQQMAQTPITVVAANQSLPAVLQIINPNTGIAYTGTSRVVGTLPVTTRGSGFSPDAVNLFVDSTGGKNLGATMADQNGLFTVTFTWPLGVTGPHNILAQQNATQATAPVYAENPPT
jgi:hypothetical protein